MGSFALSGTSTQIGGEGNQGAVQVQDLQAPSNVSPALAALVRNPTLRVEVAPGETYSLDLQVSTIAIQNIGELPEFRDVLDVSLLQEARDWSVVLRGSDSASAAKGALILRKDSVSMIVTLPSGQVLRTTPSGAAATAQGAFSGGREQQEFARPPFSLTEIRDPNQGLDYRYLHLSPTPNPGDFGRSVQVSKHIWTDVAIDPVNVLVYHRGDLLEATLEDVGWYDTTSVGLGVCGTDKNLQFFDQRHGGQDEWKLQSKNWQIGQDPSCVHARYHGREFVSSTGDTHIPGFDDYRPFPVHWECPGHAFSCVHPQRGQDQLLTDMAEHPNVGNIWFFETYFDDDCMTCERWDGWTDVYELTDGTAEPCQGTRPIRSEIGGSVEAFLWSCNEHQGTNEAFPIHTSAICDDNYRHYATSGSGRVFFTRADSNYFYFRSETVVAGYDVEGDSSHGVRSWVQHYADLLVADGQHGSGDPNSYEIESSLGINGYMAVRWFGDEMARVHLWPNYRAPLSDAGEDVDLTILCTGVGLETDLHLYKLWLTRNQLTPGVDKITVNFDSYQPTGYFSKYEAYHRQEGTSSWLLGATSSNQATSSLTVSSLDCTKDYQFKMRLVWNGAQAWRNGYSESYQNTARPNCSSGGGGGGSPFIAPWNGTAYQPDNNILPLSEVFGRESLDVDDHYRLHAPLLSRDGAYSLKLVEFEDEHSFFDSVALWTVDHDSDTRIGVHPQTGEILTYEDPDQPVSAVDNYGRDVRTALTAWDGAVYEGWRGDYVELNFGIVPRENARLVIVADAYLLKTRIYVQVWNGTDWELADTMHHRMNFAEDVIDLSRFVPTQDDLRVRLLAASRFALEQVGLDTSPPKAVSVLSAALLNAVHSSGTDVTGLLSDPDASYAELVPGEEILLTFEIPTTGDEARSYIFVSRGHYVHKYQPLQGTEVNADNLSVFFESVIPEAPLGQFWELEIVRLEWDMGDGTLATGRTVSHVYAQAGEYRIAVRIEYSDGMAKFYERVILVFA